MNTLICFERVWTFVGLKPGIITWKHTGSLQDLLKELRNEVASLNEVVKKLQGANPCCDSLSSQHKSLFLTTMFFLCIP